MQLYIGNKNYSSWSMRPWVALRQFGIPFKEVMLRFDGLGPESRFKQSLAKVSPAGTVPVLVDDGFAVWDTLAIAEYLAEKFPAHALWPRDVKARARARSLCAEMHGGFRALRSACSMNIEASLPAIGQRIWAEQAAVRDDLARLVSAWEDALAASGGPFLFGAFSMADAYFAPVVSRIRTYGLPLPADAAAWAERVWASDGVSAWVAEALAEQDFVDFDEPYRRSRAD
ncbi:glutathione S-transferase family protein [Ideonella sp.]|uniref:glutathione S-transferase family protein n=1 Tax=Ideonella sp. TaxID=1929293 RepID=UPI002B469EB5|nr:glutathione S-transferase family protein [Ideonella sp.]HJV71780.1 glutathione S-transferase family protein [Ideonella sp.]